ncbi:hypothetical protein BDZ94DRAFT_1357550 [Collybia nuda]|uniref:Uncharacterized protein n=1 Tax=Collybia nuda TaxID=64659 RepID=A0A9P6CQG4_9AGAR|nr:hypothetical protein BDZ94DRAFT_1357550 [Collybia nuda]
MKRASRGAHLVSKKHTDAVAGASLVAAVQPIPEIQPPTVIHPAKLTIADIFALSDEDDPSPFNDNGHRIMDNILIDDEDRFYDSDRHEVNFSAGIAAGPITANRSELVQTIEALDHFEHTIFGESENFDAQSDSTIPNIVTAMQVMECGTPEVPTFTALRKKQAELTHEVNIETLPHTTSLGNEFYMNHPAALLALDWANPLVREFIQVYPEVTDKVSEMRHAAKWIDELCELSDGRFIIPVKWVIINKQECAQAYEVAHDSVGGIFHVQTQEVITIPTTHLQWNMLDLIHSGHSIKFSATSPAWLAKIKNPIRETAQGRPVFVMRIIPWSDDVSGNVSKQWNAHMNIYIANANLPHRKVSQEYFVRFCSTSPHASSSEQFDVLSEDFASGVWHHAYDCLLEEDILFGIRPHVLPADNPQQAESTSNAGVNSNLWCRYDKSGGTSEERETDAGYQALFKPGVPRTPEETVGVIKSQILAACLGVQDAIDVIQTATGVKDKTAQFWMEKLIIKARELQKERIRDSATQDPRLKDKKLKGDDRKSLKVCIKEEIQRELFAWVLTQPPDRYKQLTELRARDHYNILLGISGLDPHKDSPCEILHTILLGEDKYLWHDTTKAWDKAKGDLFATRLQASSIDGLSIAPLRAPYLIKYKNSLIGKHYKALQQLTIFHIDESLCSKYLFDLWKAQGELGALLWYPEIKDMAAYLENLQICVENVLDIWGLIDPARIQVKYKLHVLTHIIEDVRRFGPAVLFSTEIFECWNAIFRLCSVLSNHLAPSHDIAVTLADMERFKHQVSGGWWTDKAGNHVQAGKNIRGFLSGNKELQRRLGWVDTALFKSVSRDVCKDGSWVFFKSPASNSIQTGCIFKIVIPATSTSEHSSAIVIIKTFIMSDVADPRLNMPVLLCADKLLLVSPAILFIFNSQHDCRGAGCKVVEEAQPVMQGRNVTKLKQAAVIHAEDTRYFLNMHALHNANLIRDTIPPHLSKPKHYFTDRQAKHIQFAEKVRVSGPEKRAQTVAKAKATRERKKGKKNTTAEESSGGEAPL